MVDLRFRQPRAAGIGEGVYKLCEDAWQRRPSSSYGPLRELVRPYILRRLKTDKTVIADLPDKTEMKAFCPLSRKQAALYQQAVKELAEQLEDADGNTAQRTGAVVPDALQTDLQSSVAVAGRRRLERRATAANGRACARLPRWSRPSRKRCSSSPSSAR